MKIIQMSDFHFNSATDMETIKRKILIMYSSLELAMDSGEQLVFCFCGDIFDEGGDSGFEKAAEAFKLLADTFGEFKTSFVFVPGNHDIINNKFDRFDELICKFDSEYKYSDQNFHVREFDDIILILGNTAYHKNHKFGSLGGELDKIIESVSDKPLMLVTHHTVMSRYDEDSSSIRNAYELTKILEKYKFVGHIHGHTHGYSNISLGSSCRVVGVGSLFKHVKDVSNQFNLLHIKAGNIHQIENFRYEGDTRCFNGSVVYDDCSQKVIEENNVSRLYNKALLMTRSHKQLNNLNLKLDISYPEFKDEMLNNFSKDIEMAELWQAKDAPPELYYSHGEYMHHSNDSYVDCMDYVTSNLMEKATTSRAIIPLISMKNVMESGDGFLPSLNLIQFGFNDESKTELYVTMYLRALEVKHFLRINLSEAFLLIEQLVQKITSVTRIKFDLIAFKAQVKEEFSCFIKAKIDYIDPYELSGHVHTKPNVIVELLEEKSKVSETVIVTEGLEHLYNLVLKGNSPFKKESLINEFEKVLGDLKALKESRARYSHHDKNEELEENLKNSYSKLIAEAKAIVV